MFGNDEFINKLETEHLKRVNTVLAEKLSTLNVLEDCPSRAVAAATERGCGVFHFIGMESKNSEQAAIEAFRKSCGIVYVDLSDEEQYEKSTLEDYQALLPKDFSKNRKVLPLREENDLIIAAFANPMDVDAQRAIQFVYGKQVKIVIAEESKILKVLGRLDQSRSLNLPHTETIETDSTDAYGGLEKALDTSCQSGSSLVKLVNQIFVKGVLSRASDIHIEPQEKLLDVRFRVDGKLQNFYTLPGKLKKPVIARLKLVAGMDISERRKPQDGRIRISVSGKNYDLRVSSIPIACGEKIVMRVLDAQSQNLDLEYLGLPDATHQSIVRALESDAKMLLVTGPTGSGKSTTLYGCLKHLTDGTTNIVTVENPIEYQLPGVNQTQINPGSGVTFASVLRSLLRQDPDVIMLGEIRDQETAEIAIQAAQTGHKVLSTLHTNDAVAAIGRLFSLEVERDLLANSLAGVLAQRLVRKLCSKCKELVNVDRLEDEVCQQLEHFQIDPSCLYEAVGCKSCEFSGYKGRLGIYSYLEITDEIAQAIASGISVEDLTEKAINSGFITLQQAALGLSGDGLTSIDEIKPYLKAFSTSTEDGAQEVVSDTPAEPESLNAKTEPPPEKKVELKKEVKEKAQQRKDDQKRVLLVDDEPIIRSMITWMLGQGNFVVVQADGVNSAIEKIEEEKPDLILSDLMMPELDGTHLLKWVKENEEYANIPVIILTGSGSDKKEVELLELGATDFIGKSASPDIVMLRLRKALKSAVGFDLGNKGQQ